MNKWQEYYCNKHYNGGVPKTKTGKESVELLGKVKSVVMVDFPERKVGEETIEAHTEEYIVTEEDCNIPNGTISVDVLVSNLRLWLARGQKITTK